MSTSTTKLKVGIILLSQGVQLLDLAPADLLGTVQKSYLQACKFPPELVDKGQDEFEWYFVSERGPGNGLFPATANFQLGVTDSIHTCPPLDIVLIGGSEPSYYPSPAVQTFLKDQFEQARAFMTFCTGVFPVLHSGILTGRTATAPRGLLPMLQADFSGVKWEDKRWANDGKLWTGGGLTNGFDAMAAFMRNASGTMFDPQIVSLMLSVADVGARGQEYPTEEQ